MKTVSQIISHLSLKPQFRKISQKRCFMKVIQALPPYLSKAVLFTYTKNSILYIALNHPGLKMEFHYKNNLIKSLLKQIKTLDKECKDIEDIKDIKYFVSNQVKKNQPFKQKLTFKERSTGDFEIKTDDIELKRLFQKIQERIKLAK